MADAEDNPEKSINDTLEVMVQKYDLIGFLDEYSSFTDTLRDQAKLRLSYQNRKVNVTQGRLAINDVHQSTISKIEQINQLDIVLYSKLKDSIGRSDNLKSLASGPTTFRIIQPTRNE